MWGGSSGRIDDLLRRRSGTRAATLAHQFIHHRDECVQSLVGMLLPFGEFPDDWSMPPSMRYTERVPYSYPAKRVLASLAMIVRVANFTFK